MIFLNNDLHPIPQRVRLNSVIRRRLQQDEGKHEGKGRHKNGFYVNLDGRRRIQDMAFFAWIAVAIAFWAGQGIERPAYLNEGDRVEQEFRQYRDRLDRFFDALRDVVTMQTPQLLPDLRGRPPVPVAYGYQML